MPSQTDIRSSTAAEREEQSTKGFDLSITQVVAGALAAMTAAALGSRLSVTGTVVGAALASIIAAVAGALYTASLRRTHQKVRSVWTGAAGGTPTRVEVVTEQAAAAETDAATAEPQVERRSPWRSGRLWKRIAIGAVATFALAAGAVTGFELVSGQALSGGSGTTFEQVREPRSNAADTDERESSESPSPEASETPSTDASPEPSTEPTTEPTTQPSSPPSEEPSSSTSGDATSEPSASSEPNTSSEPN